jgi:hypothetical protein
MYVCMYYICMYVCMYGNMYVCMYVYMYVCYNFRKEKQSSRNVRYGVQRHATLLTQGVYRIFNIIARLLVSSVETYSVTFRLAYS